MPRSPSLTTEEVTREWRLLVAVPHAELGDFIRTWFRARRSWITRLHLTFVAAAFLALAFAISITGRGVGATLVQIALAVPAILIVILPLHEALHHLGYRLAGAPAVRWSAGGGMVYVIADKFVARWQPLTYVALAPFVIINAALIAVACSTPRWSILCATLLVLHSAASAGDWAMLNFFWHHRHEEVVTFDDAAAQKTYFYAR